VTKYTSPEYAFAFIGTRQLMVAGTDWLCNTKVMNRGRNGTELRTNSEIPARKVGKAAIHHP